MANIRVTAYDWVPPLVQGLVRDLRVRWALEEAGFPYEVELLPFGEQKGEPHLQLQPFGQIPVYREDDVVLFESGAIVLHVAELTPVLMPADPVLREKVRMWIFAALNTVELPVLIFARMLPGADPAQREQVTGWVETRLAGIAASIGDRGVLVDTFSAADLMMSAVLRPLARQNPEMLARYPAVDAYVRRCEARPAFQKALADQLRAYAEHPRSPGSSP